MRTETNLHKARWISSLLARGTRYGVVTLAAVDDVDQLDWLEKNWIAFGRLSGWPLTNIHDGGDAPRSQSAETKAKIGAASRSRIHPKWSEEMRAAVSASWRQLWGNRARPGQWSEKRRAAFEHSEAERKAAGRKHHNPSQATRRLWSEQRLGRVMTEAQKEKLRVSLRAVCASAEARRRLSAAGRLGATSPQRRKKP